MDITTLFMILKAVFVLVLLISIPGLLFMMTDKPPQFTQMIEHRQKKELLRHSLYQYRLSSMLRHLGIPLETYVMELPEGEIRRHVTRCKTCPNVAACDHFLDGGKPAGDVRFCPNYGSLVAYSKNPALKITADHLA